MNPIVPCELTLGGEIPKNKYHLFLRKMTHLYKTENEKSSRIAFIDASIKELNSKPLVLNINCSNGTLDPQTLLFLQFLKLTFIFRMSAYYDKYGINMNECSYCSDPTYGLKEIKTNGRNKPVVCVEDVQAQYKRIRKEYEKPIEDAALLINKKDLSGRIARMKLENKSIWDILDEELIAPYNYVFPEVPPLVIV